MKSDTSRSGSKKGLIIFGAAVLAAASAWYFCKPIYYRLYPFDRIRGRIQINVDGQPAELSEASAQNIFRCEDMSFRRNADGSADISITAGEYGSYGFGISAENFSRPIEVTVMQLNWWSVTEFDLLCDIDTAAETVRFTCGHTTIAEDGKRLGESIADTVGFSAENLRFYIGG